jgi:hypothetical protein
MVAMNGFLPHKKAVASTSVEAPGNASLNLGQSVIEHGPPATDSKLPLDENRIG